MRTLQSAPASPLLRPFVRAFAQRTAIGVREDQAMPAYLETVLQFDFGDLPIVRSRGGGWEAGGARNVVGPHTFPGTSVRLVGRIDSFAIFLQPMALPSLFGVPIGVVMETHHEADAVLGRRVADLGDALAETVDFHERIRTAEAYLFSCAAIERAITTVTAAATLLARHAGGIAIDDLASRMQLSVRQLERLFIREVGIAPKRFARVARFQSALDARVGAPGRTWLQIATAAGYHDQMHLIHDFQAFSGAPPTRILEQLGDSRPPALAASTHPHADSHKQE